MEGGSSQGLPRGQAAKTGGPWLRPAPLAPLSPPKYTMSKTDAPGPYYVPAETWTRLAVCQHDHTGPHGVCDAGAHHSICSACSCPAPIFDVDTLTYVCECCEGSVERELIFPSGGASASGR